MRAWIGTAHGSGGRRRPSRLAAFALTLAACSGGGGEQTTAETETTETGTSTTTSSAGPSTGPTSDATTTDETTAGTSSDATSDATDTSDSTATTTPTTGTETETETETDTQTSGPMPAVCGNGQVEDDEICDDGNDDDGDACTNACEEASCGDGIVWAGVEGCDDGNDLDDDECTNACTEPACGDGIVQGLVAEECDDGNDIDTDACPSTCKNPYCGDGFHYPDEELCDDGGDSPECDADCTPAVCGDGYINDAAGEMCDDGDNDPSDACVGCQEASCGDGYIHEGFEECDDGNQMSNDGCDAQCVTEWMLVFVTSELYKGDLGGLDGADEKCQTRAEDAGLPGEYKAWLSVPGEGPNIRFTHSTKPYRLVNGTVVATNWSDLTDGSLDAPIDRTELDGPAPPGSTNCGGGGKPTVWSATNWNGEPGAFDACDGWLSQDGSGAWGLASETNVFWTNWCSNGPCSWTSALYCFQQ